MKRSVTLPRRALALAVLVSCACGPKVDPGLTVLVAPANQPLVTDFVRFIGDDRLHLVASADPAKELKGRGGLVIALVQRDDCAECYRLDGDGKRLTVTGGLPLGLQYGLAHALETFGYRFTHPFRTKTPDTLAAAPTAALGQEYAPETKKRRGLHLHTLHPIEGLFSLWVPTDAHRDAALRILDFVIKNRGNFVQWAGLDDITDDAATRAAWAAHTQAITSVAHARGLKTGIGVELFGSGNLQNAFDLIDDTSVDPKPELVRRFHVLLDGVGFDTVNLSFGEFFGADPALFVERVNDAYDALQAVQPGTEMEALIHVGNAPPLRVTWQGTTQLYYFLVRYANPAITPWIHTVMYYDLYEDAGGAYLHDQFDEHRAFLEEKLKAGAPVGYFPEDAYWVAFDDCVPVFLPVYLRSRHLDLTRLNAVGHLDDHVLFSTGWEWGYWLTDALALRMTYGLPATWDAPVADLFAAWPQGAAVADLVRWLGEREHDALIGQRLAAYLAGRDQLMDAGRKLGIISQPDRVDPDAVLALSAADRAAFVTKTVQPLAAFAQDLTALSQELEALGLPADPWLDELRDGFAVTAARARFTAALYQGTVAHADTGADSGWLQKADAALADGQAVVARRRKALWWPDVKAILGDGPNPTFYKYGYLREANSLCFWNRERAQARNAVLHEGNVVPGCVL